ncbi:type I restriction enzyme HsdR N-terminal domain-containing protein [Desulfogranum japonicum]|uniref:type I restriction enzyme HsdR N-terminal domain-containing protein n=1 Tax=Desulfogranum japonicum TaxID=231447 RepID=UPI00042A5E33|nr:type I restriction enzyme HsdR N-terminal domain-containing protein [Desulfogranum japonicum]
MIDTSGHHIVYGTLLDYLTGEELPDTDDERVRQDLARMFVEELGYAAEELQPRLQIRSEFNNNQVVSTIELLVTVNEKRVMIVRYGPGSLVTREKAAIAAARILDSEYRIPLAVVTNGRDAELLETGKGKILATGMEAIPSRREITALVNTYGCEPYPDKEEREKALRILNVFDEEICCAGGKCEQQEEKS